MRVTSYADAAQFVRELTPQLCKRPLENNVFLGVSERIAAKPQRDHLRLGVWEEDQLVLAALMTPPYRLNLAHAGRGAEGVNALRDHLLEMGANIPGVASEKPIAEAFEGAWYARCGGKRQSARERWLYRAAKVIYPAHVQGEMRLASQANLDRHCAWELAFTEEVNATREERDTELIRKRVLSWFKDDALFDWTIGGSAVAQGGVIPIGEDGARVLAIYTPPENRGRGYAQAITAALTQHAFDQGRWCVLYTDVDNPITNKIYPRVGYMLVAPFLDIIFASA
jgi:predicted GNAT family acetyltransferase